jgi:ATP-dependent RNA helicase DDX41
VAKRSRKDHDTIRDKLRIDCSGENIPAPCTAFKQMRLPRATLKCLKKDKIKTPSPIQVQGLPVILSGRDCVGISYTGSGKTLVFALPMILLALQVRFVSVTFVAHLGARPRRAHGKILPACQH